MLKLPERKAGIVCCSGEELPEGTISRLAALRVLEQLRPRDTVRICLPLFLAGGPEERGFARTYPTITIDGCEKRCAAQATERLSGKPARSLQIREIIAAGGLGTPAGLRKLNPAGEQIVEATAAVVAGLVDEVLGRKEPKA